MFTIRIKSLFLAVIVFGIISSAFSTVPSGYYYFVKNKKKAELKTAIHTYCTPLKEFDYGSGPGFTWEGFFSTDRRADSTVIDMYSNTVRKFGGGFTAITGMHIEHSFPKSWWGAYPNEAYKDLFHLYPADASANESKNNLPLGEVTGTPGFNNGVTKVGKNGFGIEYSDNCFEPADEFKGDFARSYFYIASVYENLAPLMQSPMVINNSTYPFWKPWAIDLLLKWNKQDPVSAKELTRIETIYNIQGNRNPFIDYPDLAEYIWGADTTKVYPFPDELNAFLITPRRGTSLDFGVILQNDVRTKTLHIQAVNLNSDLQVSLLKNSSTLSLSTQTIPSASALSGFDLSITFTPAVSGIIRDTLLIQGNGLSESLRIPIKALATADFITLEPSEITPVGGTLNWISDPLATQYRLNVYQGDQKAGDLIISTYVEGTSWNKAIELYNGTGKTIDLSKYYLQKQSDGAGSFGYTLKLNGTLANGKSYVIVHKQAGTDLMAKQQLVTDTLLQFNGNDAIALVRNGITIDMVGKANAGANVIWGLDVTLQRKSFVTHPKSTFNPTEWSTLKTDSIAMLGNHVMNLVPSSNYILQNQITGLNTSYAIQNLAPGVTYTYSVESMRSGVIAPSINTMQLQTAELDVPEISDASNIKTNEFTANWGSSPYASGYLLNVLELNGKSDTTVVEGFANVGSSGTPLPTGWTGTASGNYTTTTSSGIAIPSISLKNKGEWLQTKTYPQPVSAFSFMYRFPTVITASSLIVDGLSNNNWVRVDSILCKNSNKIYPAYTFTKSQGMTAFKFRFNKEGAGNLSIDDVSATYGNQDTIFVLKDKSCISNFSVITGLKENSTYYYNARASLGSSASSISETMSVNTLTGTKTNNVAGTSIKISQKTNQISISGLNGDETIELYSITGLCMYKGKASGNEKNIPFRLSGLFIIKIQNNLNTYTAKILK